MEMKYVFVSGEETLVKVYDNFEKIIIEIDRNLCNNGHTETRCHVSLDAFNRDKKVFTDTALGFEERISNWLDSGTLYKAIPELNSDERELLCNLYLIDKPMT